MIPADAFGLLPLVSAGIIEPLDVGLEVGGVVVTAVRRTVMLLAEAGRGENEQGARRGDESGEGSHFEMVADRGAGGG